MTAAIDLALSAATELERRGDIAAAAVKYQQVTAAEPDHPAANLRLAQFARHQGRVQDAHALLQRATQGATRLRVASIALPVFAELADLERATGHIEASLAAVEQGLAVCGEQPWLLWEECESLRAANRSGDRLHRLNRLALLQPNDRVILTELGLALLSSANAHLAMKPLRRAVELGLSDLEIELALCVLEALGGEPNMANTRLQKLALQAPGHFGVFALQWLVHQTLGRWAQAEAMEAELFERIARDEVHIAFSPFMLLLTSAPPATLRRYAEAFSRASSATQPPVPSSPIAPAVAPTALQGRRLRVGYLSADLHEHATAILMAGLFEQHDTKAVDVFVYSYGPRVEDAYRHRLQQALPQWRDLNNLSDEAAAAQIRADAIDVLVELKGHTTGTRLRIVAHHPAPVVLHYLGYPGTLACEGVEYLVADGVTIPPDHEPFYAEKILRLPNSYQVNDDRRTRSSAVSREALGLPPSATVLCNFNQSTKWTRSFIECWLRALSRGPDVVLWLLEPNSAVKSAVIDAATRLGVTASQIIWAPKVTPEAHIARLGAADLALDQWPYGSHTTGADALWCGVPLLTCLGGAFHGRVGVSLVRAAGLPQFACDDLIAYETRLAELLDHPQQLAAAKTHLRKYYAALSLFDTVAFARDWESLLTTAFLRHQQAQAR